MEDRRCNNFWPDCVTSTDSNLLPFHTWPMVSCCRRQFYLPRNLRVRATIASISSTFRFPVHRRWFLQLHMLLYLSNCVIRDRLKISCSVNPFCTHFYPYYFTKNGKNVTCSLLLQTNSSDLSVRYRFLVTLLKSA